VTPLSVLHVAQPTDAGVAGYVAAAAADQQARGWRVTVASPDGGRLADDLAAAGVRWLHWPARRSPGPSALGEAARLRRLVAAADPQVVHLHSAKAGLAGRLALRGRLPTLFQPHGWSWLAVTGPVAAASTAWERAAARWTDLFVCVGDGEAAQGAERRVPGRYEVVRNGVDLTRFRPADAGGRAHARARLGITPGVPLVACVGRLTRQKGQDVLLAAWPRVSAAVPAAELALVGDGDLAAALLPGAPAGVRFAGTAADVRPWYAAADVVVLPSRWEGLSLTALEAMAAGRPVVASRIPGIAEVVPADAGLLVPPDDPYALAGALVRVLSEPGLTEAAGRAAAAHAAAGFDVRETFDRLAGLTAQAAGLTGVRRERR
jgi:glycosyltransferase involved in cell wall biosynthesis